MQAESSSVSDILKKPSPVALTKKGKFVYRQQFMSETLVIFSASSFGVEANRGLTATAEYIQGNLNHPTLFPRPLHLYLMNVETKEW